MGCQPKRELMMKVFQEESCWRWWDPNSKNMTSSQMTKANILGRLRNSINRPSRERRWLNKFSRNSGSRSSWRWKSSSRPRTCSRDLKRCSRRKLTYKSWKSQQNGRHSRHKSLKNSHPILLGYFLGAYKKTWPQSSENNSGMYPRKEHKTKFTKPIVLNEMKISTEDKQKSNKCLVKVRQL